MVERCGSPTKGSHHVFPLPQHRDDAGVGVPAAFDRPLIVVETDPAIPSPVVGRHEPWKAVVGFHIDPTTKADTGQCPGIDIDGNIDGSTCVASTRGSGIIDIRSLTAKTADEADLTRILSRRRVVAAPRGVIVVSFEGVVAEEAPSFGRKGEGENKRGDQARSKSAEGW